MTILSQTPGFLLLLLGFGFVIFFHELGHFLAAKWVGIKVEQFAVGFGHALIAFRKGIGIRVGSSTAEAEKRVADYLASEQGLKMVAGLPESASDAERQIAAYKATGIGETEYRLNWIPLGGYVKMLGQDDLRPGADASDPRAYNKKSIGARMLVVSAGVIMNVILAALGFMTIFLIGFNVAPAAVGSILPGSPAQKAYRIDAAGKQELAPLEVGDSIEYFDDKRQHDFTKITLNTALVHEGSAVPMIVKRVNGQEDHLLVTPSRMEENDKNFLMLGIGMPYQLSGLDARDAYLYEKTPENLAVFPQDTFKVAAEEKIVAVNGQSVDVKDFAVFDRALQNSHGQPVKINVESKDGVVRQEEIHPIFVEPFRRDSISFAGLLMRPSVRALPEYSTVINKLMPGDVIVTIKGTGDAAESKTNATADEFRAWLNSAGQNDKAIDLVVIRQGKEVEVKDLKATFKIERDNVKEYGLGIGLGSDQENPIVAGTVNSSPAAEAGVPSGAKITQVDGKPVKNWFEVRDALVASDPKKSVVIAADVNGQSRTFDFGKLSAEEYDDLRSMRYTHDMPLHELKKPRKTSNPIVALGWGVTETRDSILQFYLTLNRMFQGSISYKNAMGPVGMLYHGTKIAHRGPDWLIWFLSMISANLAVVNFLPIPIVDGGLFTFLIIEKIQGKPLSQRAQSIAQVVGLAVLLGVFLLVTYQDIARLPFLNH